MSLVTDRLYEEAPRPLVSQGTARDFYELLKPRVMQLVIFTALVGMLTAHEPINPIIGFASILAIAIGAGASGCLNMWYDATIDGLMERTSKRPIPSGAIAPGEALAFGMTLSVGSVLFLGLITNWYAAGFLAFTIFFYVVVYTMWLKHWTVQNIVIGGAAGAFPPMIGYMAVTGSVNLETFLQFLIIFIWTPPHFWALALVKSKDYARAGVPMLPVIAGGIETRRQILIYSILLAPVGMAPALFGYTSLIYLAISAVSGGIMIWLAYDLYRKREGDAARKASYRLFGTSILYLFVLFAALLLEEIVPMMIPMLIGRNLI
ncbi:MAG: heme o synthase [Beijerinckiaceae bacterium]|nr:heme o synthase [Beijerinckiaceae bacterium]